MSREYSAKPAAVRNRAARTAKKAQGICVWSGCWELAKNGCVHCVAHVLENRQWVAAHRAKLLEAGRCLGCGKPNDRLPRRLCSGCGAAASQRALKYLARKRGEAA